MDATARPANLHPGSPCTGDNQVRDSAQWECQVPMERYVPGGLRFSLARDPVDRLTVTGSSSRRSPELPAASGCFFGFTAKPGKTATFPDVFSILHLKPTHLIPSSHPRQGPLTSHCRPTTIVCTDPLAFPLDRAVFATRFPNGFDRSERACYPSLSTPIRPPARPCPDPEHSTTPETRPSGRHNRFVP